MFRLSTPELIGYRLGQGAEIHAFAAHLAARHTGEIQEIVDELSHPLAGGLGTLQVESTFLV